MTSKDDEYDFLFKGLFMCVVCRTCQDYSGVV